MAPGVKQTIKQCLFFFYLYSGGLQVRNLWQRLGGRSRIVILYYHRVGPSNVLSQPVTRFRGDMEYLARHYQCLTLRELGCRLQTGSRRTRPIAVVTFDDGYKDNFTNAFPELKACGVPATFFVSTGFIGTDRPFPHDQRAVASGRAQHADWPKMTWNDLRQMQTAGMEIGSHTVNHTDMGGVDPASAADEIRQSLEMLRRELGDGERAFCFPWGRKQNVTPAAVAAIRQAGFYAAVTTRPGVVPDAADLLDLPRVDAGNGTMTRLATLAHIEGFGNGCLAQFLHRSGGRSPWPIGLDYAPIP